MDPNQTYSELFYALRDNNHVVARRRAIDLWHWLSRGGCYPTGYSKVEVDAYLRNAMRLTEYLEYLEEEEEDTGPEQLELF